MKKSLFILATAALVLASCNNDVTVDENKTLGDQPKEIAFSAFSTPVRRVIGTGTSFPSGQNMFVSAYSTASSKDYFSSVTFVETSGLWKASPAQYWPLSPTTLNFIGITGVPYANVTWDSPTASAGANITWTHNAADMYDLMYATGQGTVSYAASGSNVLVYGNNVDMAYNHALAQIAFKVKVADASYASAIRIKKIVLNDMVTGATYDLNNSANYDDAAPAAQSASGAWETSPAPTTADTDVPGSDAFASTDMSETLQDDGAVIVPCNNGSGAAGFDSFTGFTVYFQMNGVDYDYTYEYKPSDSEKRLEQGKKYIYDLTFTLTEIVIAPRVVDWITDFDEDGDSDDDEINVIIPATFDASASATGAITLPSSAASSYSLTITGLDSDYYKAVKGTGTGDFITVVSPADYTASAVTSVTLVFKVTSDTGKNQTIEIKNDDVTPVTKFTLTVTQP